MIAECGLQELSGDSDFFHHEDGTVRRVEKFQFVRSDDCQVTRLSERLADIRHTVEPQFSNTIERRERWRRKTRHSIGYRVPLHIFTNVTREFGHALDQRAVNIFPVAMELLRTHTRFSSQTANEFDHRSLLLYFINI